MKSLWDGFCPALPGAEFFYFSTGLFRDQYADRFDWGGIELYFRPGVYLSFPYGGKGGGACDGCQPVCVFRMGDGLFMFRKERDTAAQGDDPYNQISRTVGLS